MASSIVSQEAAAAKRLDAESRRKLAKIAWEKSSLRHRDRLHMELLHNAFKRAESQLLWALNKRKAGETSAFVAVCVTVGLPLAL